MQYIYQSQKVELYIDVFKGQSSVKENFNRTGLQLFLIKGSKHTYRTPVQELSIEDDGTIMCEFLNLPIGVYRIKLVWKKNDSCLPIIAESDYLFAITNIASEATNPMANVAKLNVLIHTATYGSDGLDAYELAVLNGITTLPEKEWLESRSLTAVLQNEGDNTEASMSQAAITEALNKLRSVLGAGYRSKGKVDTLPRRAEIGDLYCLSSDMHTYGCVAFETEERPELAWHVNGSALNEITQDILKTFTVGNHRGLSCSTPEYPFFCLNFSGERFYIVACDEDGDIINNSPVRYSNGGFYYNPTDDGENGVIYATVIGQIDAGDAIYQDFGLFQTIDYIPKAKDTEYNPSATSMLGDTDNVQDGLDKMARDTPSMEQNLVLAANRNAQTVNANFQNLLTRYNKIIEVLQTLIDRVDFHTPEGFRDIAELIASLSFESLTTIRRVTSGGSFSEDTSVSGAAVCGTAVCGII